MSRGIRKDCRVSRKIPKDDIKIQVSKDVKGLLTPEFCQEKRLYIFIFQNIYGVLFFYLAYGVEHGGKYHQEDTAH